MARPRPLHALSTDLLFHRVGISRRRAAHEPKRLESPEFRPFPLALRLSYRADCQVSSCPFRPQVCGTSNRQNGTITTVQRNLPHYNSHGFNHLRLSNRPLTLRTIRQGRFVLRIDSGDASEAGYVLVYFDAKGVSQRMVYSALTPEKPSEDTRYFFTVLEDK